MREDGGSARVEDQVELSGPRLWAVKAKALAPRPRELVHPVRYARNMRLVSELVDESYTMVGPLRGRNLIELARRVDREGVPGAIVDCGVWNGGSTILMGMGAPGRRVWAFDSFEGLPAPGPKDPDADSAWEGKVRGSEETLKQGFAERAGDAERLEVVKGWFEDTLPGAAERIGEIALLHIDADWYASVRLALDTLYDNVVPGGFVAVDDLRQWQGAGTAAGEFRDERSISSRLHSHHFWRKDDGGP